MPHLIEAPELADRVRADGVAALVEAAEEIWSTRAADPRGPVAGPRPFEDAFPTFYQFSNSPQK